MTDTIALPVTPTIMHYRFGWRPQPDRDPAGAQDFEVEGYEAAIAGLMDILGDAHESDTNSIEDRGRYRVLSAAWSVFAAYVTSMGLVGGDFAAIGPDGWVYWVQKIDRS